uniref:Uncharacterized protein n=1 Tax=Cannabis sativa TaxID=3483 RepID=A0A803PWL8_CANSA
MEIGDSLLKITLMELVCSSRLHSASRNNLRRYRMNYRLIKNESDSKFDGIEVLASLDNDVFESIKLAKIRCLLFCLGNWVLTTDVGDGKRSLISEDRDSGVAFEMHLKVSGLESLIYLFVCITTSTHWMDLLHLQQFLKSKQHESPQETIQALDVVLRDAPSKL